MDYTIEDIDQLLKANEKRFMSDGKLALDGVWGNSDGARLAVVGKGYSCHIAGVEAMQDKATIDLMLGAPILAEEVKRLRAMLERIAID